MGKDKNEEEKKMEEKKPEEEEKKKNNEDSKKGDKADRGESPPLPLPPKEIVLKVYMHCDGCAKKVGRCLRGFDGVEEVITDCKSQKVVVKGDKADPMKVLERLQRKSHRRVELLSPIPKPTEAEEKPKEEEEKPKPEEKKEEPKVIIVVMKVHMHCEACAQEIKKRILRMKGVESAEPDLKGSQVTVKGTFEAAKLIEYVYKRTGKHAVIVKQEPETEPEKKEEDKTSKDEKKGHQEIGDDEEKKKDGGDGNQDKNEEQSNVASEEGGTKVVEMKKNEYYYYPPRYNAMEMYGYPPPQIFSDENPNACTVM